MFAGCVNVPEDNPNFPLSLDESLDEVERMENNPVGLQRPLVILSGYRGPLMPAAALGNRLLDLTGAPRTLVLPVAYPQFGEFPAILRSAHAQILAAVPEAIEPGGIDIVGISMGGLIARALASNAGQTASVSAGSDRSLPPRPLNVRRVFTLATPHRGATLAEIIALDPAARDMRAGSPFLQELDAHLPRRDYELVCYTRPRDTWVGATRAAPPGMNPIWTSGRLIFTHFTVHQDTRILVDLARRLRGEPPLGLPGQPPHD
jgi:pimeloyl-ACP methyl ester carboxylesterase